MPEPVTPRPASTVVLVREAGPAFEVLLLRRNASLAFLGGAFVFPGGSVDTEDADLPAETARWLGTGRLEPETEPGLVAAAARELFEEAGVLLARGDAGSPTEAEIREVGSKIGSIADLGALLTAGGWRLAADDLVPFGRIVTPRTQPRRFDTHFFLAVNPDGQEPRHDPGESDATSWIAPARAIEPDMSRELALTPPTWFTMALLAQHRSISELFAWAAARPIVQIEPVLEKAEDGSVTVRFPNEPLLEEWHSPDGIVFDRPPSGGLPPRRPV
jgi:8-oxo-dGTP pyrophosphatase MutT (NUDIX family)